MDQGQEGTQEVRTFRRRTEETETQTGYLKYEH
jgi:hypothetical protein